jgi:hypothetical protein
MLDLFPESMRRWGRRAVSCAIAAGIWTGSSHVATAQETAPREPSPWRPALALGFVSGTSAVSWVLVSAAWWTRENASSRFLWRDEGTFGLDSYAGGADKVGHFYANYVMTRAYSDVLAWGGFGRAAALVSATLLTTGFFTAIELKDAYQRSYGFSAGDVVANLTGQGAAFAMLLVPGLDDAISFRLMYFPSRDFRRELGATGRPNFAEDYSGQTYLLAFHLAALHVSRPGESLGSLRYFDVSLGFSTHGFVPLPRAPEPVSQLLSLGLAVNLQTFFDDLSDEPPQPRGTGAALLNFTNEVLQIPYTYAPVLSYERRGPPASPH